MDGRTTFEEVLRVTTTDSSGGSACPACARPVERGMVACPWCLAELEAARCRGCAKELEPAWAACPWCRTPQHHATEAHAGPDGGDAHEHPRAAHTLVR